MAKEIPPTDNLFSTVIDGAGSVYRGLQNAGGSAQEIAQANPSVAANWCAVIVLVGAYEFMRNREWFESEPGSFLGGAKTLGARFAVAAACAVTAHAAVVYGNGGSIRWPFQNSPQYVQKAPLLTPPPRERPRASDYASPGQVRERPYNCVPRPGRTYKQDCT